MERAKRSGRLTAIDSWSVDRAVIRSLALLSSCDSARLAAAVWLAAFQAALAAGVSEPDAYGRANQAWQDACLAKDSGARDDRRSMLAGTSGPWTDARPPPRVVVA